MSKIEPLANLRSVRIMNFGSVVLLHLMCDDAYEASVLADDLVERLKRGDEISIANIAIRS